MNQGQIFVCATLRFCYPIIPGDWTIIVYDHNRTHLYIVKWLLATSRTKVRGGNAEAN